MARLLVLLILLLSAIAVAAMVVGALGRAARETGRAGSALVKNGNGENTMQKIAFAALLLLLVGVTSGLIGGL